tara:strand:+ start:2302 stop:2805 length:504 start_codon:yes stop_codon:yes gene_type:complete
MKNYLTTFYLLTFLLYHQVTTAAESSPFEQLPPVYLEKFERLDNLKRETLKNYYGSTMAIAIFGINCSWCKKQHRMLKKLQNECPNFNIVMMGIGRDKQKLNTDLKRNQNKFPAFKINNNLLSALNNENVPRLILFDPKGNAKLNLLGYTNKIKLLSLLDQQLGFQC